MIEKIVLMNKVEQWKIINSKIIFVDEWSRVKLSQWQAL